MLKLSAKNTLRQTGSNVNFHYRNLSNSQKWQWPRERLILLQRRTLAWPDQTPPD